MHRLPHLLGHLQAGVDQPAGHRVRLVQQRRDRRPGQGYPRQWSDQARWNGGWELDRKGRLRLKAGGQLKKLLTIFSNPDLPAIDDYYEPFTYDYETLVDAPLSDRDPVARPHSQLTGKPMDVTWGPNWDEGLAGGPELAPGRPAPAGHARSRCA